MKTIANTEPTLQSGVTKAWKVDLQEWRANSEPNPDDASVAIWVVHAPWSHPIWPNVMIYCVHLRPKEGRPAPVIHLAGATHELVVMALDPDHVPSLDGIGGVQYLTPSNFVGQFIAEDDAAAELRTEATVQEIVAGLLNPDTDGTRQWVLRFGDHCFKPEYRNAQPGSIEHTLAQGGTVVIAGDQRMDVIPANPDEPVPGEQKH